MPYVPLDDAFHSHRKVLAAGNEATGVHVRSMSWVGANLTDGHIPHAVDDMLAPRRGKQVRELLVNVALRDECTQHNNCTIIHDWASLNDTPDVLRARRAQAAERQRKWREEKRLRDEQAAS